MRAALLTAALIAAFAVPAVAQNSSGQQGQQGYQGNPGSQNDQDNYGPRGMMWRGAGPREWGGRGDWRGGPGGFADMGHRFGPEHMREMMGIAGALGAGVFYRFKRGDDEVDIHCPPRVSVQDCVNGATELMKALPPAGSAATTGQTQH